MDMKMRLIVELFYLNQNSRGKIYHFLIRAVYRFISYWVFGVDLHSDAVVGDNLILYHGAGLVVSPHAVIGSNVILRHGVTIGNYLRKDGSLSGCPVVGDNVEFGCGSVCLGDIHVGDGAVLAANSVLTKNIPSNYICYAHNQLRQLKLI